MKWVHQRYPALSQLPNEILLATKVVLDFNVVEIYYTVDGADWSDKMKGACTWKWSTLWIMREIVAFWSIRIPLWLRILGEICFYFPIYDVTSLTTSFRPCQKSKVMSPHSLFVVCWLTKISVSNWRKCWVWFLKGFIEFIPFVLNLLSLIWRDIFCIIHLEITNVEV